MHAPARNQIRPGRSHETHPFNAGRVNLGAVSRHSLGPAPYTRTRKESPMRKAHTPLLPLLLAALLANAFARPQHPRPTATPAAPAPQQQPTNAPSQGDDDDEVVRITTNLVQVD